ncbi:MAG: hypothetical protein BWK76_21660 [Desulfobulbaceae bacterium A2]|nr:MAG: hypothetical protein BWK76_21660 [Desulfobulbaceae bacterium A2]
MQVRTLPRPIVPVIEMAAGNLTAAGEALGAMLAQASSHARILLVREGPAAKLTEYALKMAQRLDCDVIALDLLNPSLEQGIEHRRREIDHFLVRAIRQGEQLVQEAASVGVRVSHMVKIGERERIIAELGRQDTAIRYVLTLPPRTQTTVQREPARPRAQRALL